MAKKDLAPRVLISGLDSLHVAWMKHPLRAAMFGLAYAVLLAAASLLLGIAGEFEVDGVSYNGYMRTHWGPQTFLAMPIAAAVIAYLLRFLDRGVSSLSHLIVPHSANAPFIEWLGDQVARHWRLWIVPLSLFLIIILTVAADFPGIFGPLLDPLPDWAQEGWGTHGHHVAHAPAVTYFFFNVGVFGTQIFYGYSGLMALFLTSFLIRTSVVAGLSQRDETSGSLYRVKWDYRDPTGRCGLHEMDKVFVLYVTVILVAVGIAVLSVLGHKAEDHLDIGSVILVFGTLLLFPAAIFWFMIPYWSSFPTEVPPRLKDLGLVKPTPWPLRSEKLSWLLMGVALSAWVYLFTQALAIISRLFAISTE